MDEKTTKLLVVDDDPVVLDIISDILQSFGYIITSAENGTDALRKYDIEPDIELVISDINMPEMDGMTLIRELHKRTDIPVIVLSGCHEITIAVEALKSGASDFILKDENLEEMVPIAVKNVLEKKQTEKRNIQLMLDIKSKNEELESAYMNLQLSQEQLIKSEKLASLGHLVAGIAHEINTPVGISITASSHLKKISTEVLTAFEQGALKKSELEKFISTTIEDCDIICTSLLRTGDLIKSFKMVSADQIWQERRRFNVKSYIAEVLLSLMPELKKTSHKVVFNCPDDIEIESYPGVFAQILTNFIINSVTHAYENGDKGTMTVNVSVDNGKLILKYSDDGKGIALQNMEKIFDPFFTTKRSSGNTGLGLHIVFNIVNQILGGTITCHSVEKGATFVITLPIVLEEKA